MRHAVLMLCLALGALLAAPAAAQRSGSYTVAGQNLDGTPYAGTANLEQVGTASFTIIWRVGGRVIQGVGMVAGHSFAAVYGASQQPAIGIYTLQPDGRLVGTWTMVGAAGTGTETLTPLVPSPAAVDAVTAPQAPAVPRP